MKPSIGRIVHFTFPDGETWPAIIVKCHEDETVDLTVFVENGVTIGRGHVDFGATGDPSYCFWPPGV